MDAMSLPSSLRLATCRWHAATRRQATRDRIIGGLATAWAHHRPRAIDGRRGHPASFRRRSRRPPALQRHSLPARRRL